MDFVIGKTRFACILMLTRIINNNILFWKEDNTPCYYQPDIPGKKKNIEYFCLVQLLLESINTFLFVFPVFFVLIHPGATHLHKCIS